MMRVTRPDWRGCRRLVVVLFAILFLAFQPAARAGQKLKDADCLSCHGDKTMTADKGGKTVSLFVDKDKLAHSIHGSMFGCVDCHTDVKSLMHDTPPKKVECLACHADAQAAWSHSVHARAGQPGKPPAANCQDCHGGAHEVIAAADALSPVNHKNIPATCGRCHSQKFLATPNGESAQAFESYQESVHGKAVENGSAKAAVCTDCHGDHQILPGNDQNSPISKFNVPKTCGRCHSTVAYTYQASVHGTALARGNQSSPACTDCHGIHSIKAHIDPNSPVSEQNLSRSTCARCHEGVRLSEEFGVAGNRVSSYLDSYHGLAASGGSSVAANCASCHGVHNILPSSDPRSTISKANLAVTCGKCHQGVTQRFTQTRVHLDAASTTNRDIDSLSVRWVRWIYLPLIVLVIGGMFLHNVILWRHKALARRAVQNPFMQRMTVNQRWQHLVLLTSFIILVLTGFALKFPDSWLASVLALGEHWRSIVHRVAGVVLMAGGIYHIFYVIATREGRKLIRDIAPMPKDAFDLIGAMRYYLGLGGEKPKFGRFNYAEKAEYWALVWGTALMGVTGVMLWAKVWVGNLAARWLVDVATAIHYYEAILATLAIVVWHFYQVFLDPDVAPMNFAWWDGKMPVELYKHEHPLDTESVAAFEEKKEE